MFIVVLFVFSFSNSYYTVNQLINFTLAMQNTVSKSSLKKMLYWRISYNKLCVYFYSTATFLCKQNNNTVATAPHTAITTTVEMRMKRTISRTSQTP